MSPRRVSGRHVGVVTQHAHDRATPGIDRRAFFAAAGAGIASLPLALEAQQGRVPLVAILSPASASTPPAGILQFKQVLEALGWVEGRTVRFETRFGEWEPDRIERLAKELVLLGPDVLYTYSQIGTLAAMRATTSVPIVVGAAADLIALGGIRSLSHPGGNVTGVTHAQPEVDPKRLEILKQAVPSMARIGYLFQEQAVPRHARQALDGSGRLLKVGIQYFGVREPGQIDAAFVAMQAADVQGLLVQDGLLLSQHAALVTALALKHRLPTISQIPRFAELGGLLQYGADVFELFRRSARYVDKILKGAKPGDLPVEQPTTVNLVINLTTAKALGLTIPQSLLVRADQTIR